MCFPLCFFLSLSALAGSQGKITEYSKKEHLISADFPDDHGIREGDFVMIPFETGYRCRLEVVKVLSETIIAHTRHCATEELIKEGLPIESDPYGDDREHYPPPRPEPEEDPAALFHNALAGPEDDAPQEIGHKSKNEWWYAYWGAGWSAPHYPEPEKSLVDGINLLPSVGHLSLSLDVVGIYFPRKNFKTMLGSVVSLVTDRYSDGGGSVQLNQYLVSASAMHFFGTNIGNGPFLRGDLGLALVNKQSSGGGLGQTLEGTGYGFGFLAGGGYALPVSEGTRLLFSGSYAIRVVSSGTFGALAFTLGFLF